MRLARLGAGDAVVMVDAYLLRVVGTTVPVETAGVRDREGLRRSPRATTRTSSCTPWRW
jgi:hypothetical protein